MCELSKVTTDAPDQQYSQCWLIIHCTETVSYANSALSVNSIPGEQQQKNKITLSNGSDRLGFTAYSGEDNMTLVFSRKCVISPCI